jgi:transmembrane protein
MPDAIQTILRRPGAALTARAIVTLPFWTSGLSKLLDFEGGVAEMARAGLEPAIAFNAATVTTQLVGSMLVIANRAAWIGAGALGVFTALTILIVHRFWAMGEEPFRTIAQHTATEHVGMVGGRMLAAILSAHARSASGTSPHGGRTNR